MPTKESSIERKIVKAIRANKGALSNGDAKRTRFDKLSFDARTANAQTSIRVSTERMTSQ